MNVLEQLKTMTQVVADTGDFASIEQYRPQDATTNPSLITAAAQMPQYQGLVREAFKQARSIASSGDILSCAIDLLFVLFGVKILQVIPGRVSTEVDARLSYDTEKTVAKARHLISLYEHFGVSRERVLIKIASTWEGIQAAAILEKEGIHCNLTLLFNLAQAVACGDANVSLISPFVGRILDWYKKDTGNTSYLPHEDPGVVSVTNIFHYFKKFGIKTSVMGASFRNIGEIIELAGCDLLTISPALLTELQASSEVITRKLDPELSRSWPIERIQMDQHTFESTLSADRMASEKLKEGIQGFSSAIETLEKYLHAQLQQSSVQPYRLVELEGQEYCPNVRCAEYLPCSRHSAPVSAKKEQTRQRLAELKGELVNTVGEMGQLHEQLLAFQATAQGEIRDFVETLGTIMQEQASGTPLKDIKARLASRAEAAVRSAQDTVPDFSV